MKPLPPFLLAAALSSIAPAPASPPPSPDQLESRIGPAYADAPELTVPANVPRGQIHELTLPSTDSKIYPGIAKNQTGTVPYQRQVAVYVPASYRPGQAAPLLIAQDGLGYRNVLPPILDNLIAQQKIPPLVAILINSGGGDAQGSQRGLEYDTLSPTYAEFIETEVLPNIAAQFHLAFSTNPAHRATMGGSSGGAAAFTMAWFRPDLYHRVLTYSGTYVNQQSRPPPPPPQPRRIWLEVSENDNGASLDEASLHNWVLANQRLAAALQTKGYPYRYVFAQAAGHTDGRVTRQTLPEALTWLWQDFAP